jgi:hypothetical protein
VPGNTNSCISEVVGAADAEIAEDEDGAVVMVFGGCDFGAGVLVAMMVDVGQSTSLMN